MTRAIATALPSLRGATISDAFPAKFKGGQCGLSGATIPKGEPVCFFRHPTIGDRGLCLATAVTALTGAEYFEHEPRNFELYRTMTRTAAGEISDYGRALLQPEPHGWSCASDGRTA